LRATLESARGKVTGMAVAPIGPLTSVLEAVATAVGAGAVLGSVAAGMRGLVARWTIRKVERLALCGSYLGGAVGAASVVFDAVIRYSVAK
jgi:hypothetical protein